MARLWWQQQRRTCSCGKRLRVLSRMIAPRSFRSRYSFVVSYARNTACTVVKIRGLRTKRPHSTLAQHADRPTTPVYTTLPVPHEVGEDELEAAAVVLGEHVQRLRVAAQPALCRLDVQAHNAVVPDACGTRTAWS